MDTSQSADKIVLKIGEILTVRTGNTTVWTVLGSCVSVIFHVPGTLSILCHAQMPSRDNSEYQCFETCPHPCFDRRPESQDGRYVSCSIELMIRTLNEKKIKLTDINTTLIGGAATIAKVDGWESIGEKNVTTAKKMLSMHDIKINRELTGGVSGYTMWYRTDDDRMFVRLHDRKEKIEIRNGNRTTTDPPGRRTHS